MIDAMKVWKEKSSGDGEDLIFGRSVAMQLKNLKRKAVKSRAKFKIQQILHEAEMEEIEQEESEPRYTELLTEGSSSGMYNWNSIFN